MVGDFVYVHPAVFHACVAVRALVFIDFHTENGNGIEQRVECSERADEAAECPVAEHADEKCSCQDKYLPRKQETQVFAQALIRDDERYGTFQSTCGTDVFAETGKQFYKRNGNGKNEQDHVFELRQDACEAALFYLRDRDLVKEFLKEPERAQEAADQPSQKDPEEQQCSYHIVRDPVFR